MPENGIRIVVQARVPGSLGSAFVRVYGFAVSGEGAIADLDESALWEFT
jgi:hypothetical protein